MKKIFIIYLILLNKVAFASEGNLMSISGYSQKFIELNFKININSTYLIAFFMLIILFAALGFNDYIKNNKNHEKENSLIKKEHEICVIYSIIYFGTLFCLSILTKNNDYPLSSFITINLFSALFVSLIFYILFNLIIWAKYGLKLIIISQYDSFNEKAKDKLEKILSYITYIIFSIPLTFFIFRMLK